MYVLAVGVTLKYYKIMQARIKKTIRFFEDRQNFMNELVTEIAKAIIKSDKKGIKPTFRLNSYSDIRWESIKIDKFGGNTIYELFPDVEFYDYTKLRKIEIHLMDIIPTYSHWGDWDATKRAMARGQNVAMVFDKRDELPKTFMGRVVVDGDKTDLRTPQNDGENVIVGLRAKMSKAKIDEMLKEKNTLS